LPNHIDDDNSREGSSSIDDVETSCIIHPIRNLEGLHFRYSRRPRPGRQLGAEFGQGSLRTPRPHLDLAVREVPDPAGEAQPLGLPQDEVPESDPLDSPRDDVTPSYAAVALRCRIHSTRRGSMDTPMMPRTTRLKLSRTKGRFPKKYPAVTQMDTQATPPKTLKPRKRP